VAAGVQNAVPHSKPPFLTILPVSPAQAVAVGRQEQAELYRDGIVPQLGVMLGGKPVVAVLVVVV
jgi:hypothetical protein